MQRSQPKKPQRQRTHTHTQLHSCVAVLESEEKKFMPFKISKVLSKRINYMHVQQAEAEARGKWEVGEGGAPKPNVQQHDDAPQEIHMQILCV